MKKLFIGICMFGLVLGISGFVGRYEYERENNVIAAEVIASPDPQRCIIAVEEFTRDKGNVQIKYSTTAIPQAATNRQGKFVASFYFVTSCLVTWESSQAEYLQHLLKKYDKKK